MAGSAFPPGWLIPDWPAPDNVRAVFTARSGGASHPPFDSFNLGDHVRDDPATVSTNRTRLSDLLGVRPVFLNQVHGTAVVELSPGVPDGTEADACVGVLPGLACTIMVADCLPVLLTTADGSVVGAAHAGWRGLAGDAEHGVLETLVDALLGRAVQVDPSATRARVLEGAMAWLGPCIGPDAFEVGPEVRAAFVAGQADAARAFTAKPGFQGKYLANLSMLARGRLKALGIRHVYGNDGGAGWCTVTQTSVFFSHRRDAARLGSTGRMAASIWRV